MLHFTLLVARKNDDDDHEMPIREAFPQAKYLRGSRERGKLRVRTSQRNSKTVLYILEIVGLGRPRGSPRERGGEALLVGFILSRNLLLQLLREEAVALQHQREGNEHKAVGAARRVARRHRR